MIRALVALVALAGSALAQPARQAGDETVPVTFDADACKPVKKKPPGNGKKPGDAPVQLPTMWNDFEITGSFVDRKGLERDLLGPILNRHTAITDDTREEIAATAAQFGYHVVGLGTRELDGKTNAVLHIAPMPIVRRVEVDIAQSLLSTPFEDEVKRRMRVRTGTYLPWPPDQRKCVLAEEKRRIQEFLRDEGYFEAVAKITEVMEGVGATLEIEVALGPKYVTDIDRIFVPEPERIAAVATVGEIREKFREYGTCFAGRKRLCVGSGRFTRANYEAGKQEVIEMFRQKGYPAVSVRVTDPDPDRRTKTVGFQVTIDPRRKVDVQFEGAITVPLAQLRAQLTFNKAASFDDVEKNESARAITSFLQSKGFFDARVTWYIPETAATRGDQYQPLVFQIHQGAQRTVRTVQFSGNSAISTDELTGSVGTKSARLSTSLLGSNAFTTSTTLSTDVERIVTMYRRRGYRDVRVRVAASTDPNAIGSAAYTAALLSADHGADLHVRFTIEEGLPTLLSEVHVELGDEGDKITTAEQRVLCTEVLKELAQLHATPQLATLATPDQCIAIAPALEFREEDARATKDQLRDRLFSKGRPRATVDYEPVVIGQRRIAAVYTLRNTQHLRVGKIVIRGNFRTQDWVILDRLRLKEGAPLTSDSLAESTRELRNTALFDSVNIRLPDLDYATAGAVNAVVEVTERHDTRVRIDLELGYSSFNGVFMKVAPQFKNLLGLGISFDTGVTAGFDPEDAFDGELTLRQFSLESTLRFPRWLMPIEVDAELTGFHRRQDTPRFGPLKTTGGTLAFSRTWSRGRTLTTAAQAVTVGVQYDFRSRERNVDALRPAGADDDESQVPITTRTSIFGASIEWERRVDRSNNLQPLAPEGGFRLEGRASIAEGLVLGEDYFVKLAVAGSKYWSPTNSLTLRADVRYDHGIPLAGAALLPEVERFFAGGDSTVRGYDDDRLATEIIQVGVPPLANVDQIRILPAGGNIRLLGSVDAQLRIWKLLTTAIFADAGVITNQWSTVTQDDIRPSVGMALVRIVTPFGAFAFERAMPLRPRLGDDPRGRWHISFAARAQF